MCDIPFSPIDDVGHSSWRQCECAKTSARSDFISALGAIIDPCTANEWRVPDLSQVWSSKKLADRLIRNAARTRSAKTTSLFCILLDHEDPSVICSAALHVGIRKSAEAVSKLLTLLGHVDDFVVNSAARALGHIGTTKAIPKLIALLTHDEVMVVSTAITALGDIKAKEATPLLFDFLWSDKPRLISSSALALAALRFKEAIARTIELLEHDCSYVVSSACKALASLQANEAVPRIIELLRHDDSDVVFEATCALADLKAVDAVSQIADQLEHDDSNVYIASALAVGQLGGVGASDKCLERLVFHLTHTYKPMNRFMLSESVEVVCPHSRDHRNFLELLIDPYEDRRDGRIDEAFKLESIQEIVRGVFRERGRRRADREEVLNALTSEFWLAARRDPLFGASTKRIMQDLFPSIRRRLSGIVYSIVCREHSSISGKSTIDGVQRRVWQINNNAVFLTTASTCQQSDENPVVQLYAFLKNARQLGRISTRQERVFELLFWSGLTQEQAAIRLGVTRKTVQRDFSALKDVIRNDFSNPYGSQC